MTWKRDRRFLAERDETAGILKQLKGVTSADLFALKKGLDRETTHQSLMKVEPKEVSVLRKALQEKETVDLKLEQRANEVAKSVEAQQKAEVLPRLARPPLWRDKLQSIGTRGQLSRDRGCCRTKESGPGGQRETNRGNRGSMLWRGWHPFAKAQGRNQD